MSHSSHRNTKADRYNEDGIRIRKEQEHGNRLKEKHLRNALHSKSLDLSEFLSEDDDDDDLNPHWLYQDGD